MWTTKPPLNLQKQVLKNQDDIETLKGTHFVEGGFNMTAVIKYKEASLAALQAHTAFNEPLGTFGMVGDVLYVVAKTGKAEQLWKELGVFPAVGPQGPQGATGATGPQGAKGDTGLPALTYGSTINVDTIPQIGHDFSWAPMFSSNFNRTPVVGDVLTALVNHQSIEDSYMCSVVVSEYSFPTLKGTYKNVTKATGPKGKDGIGFEDIANFTLGNTTNVDYNTTDGARFIGQSSFVDYDGKAYSQTSITTLPIKGGNGITVGAASDNKSLEVKVGDTIKLDTNQTLKIVNPFNTKYIEIGNNKMDFSKVATRFSVDSLDYDAYAKNNYGPNIKTEEGVIASSGLSLHWLGLNMCYEMTDVPSTSTSGTLPDNTSWTYLTTHPDELCIRLNSEFYQFADNQYTAGTLVYSHAGYDGSSIVIKAIIITISNRTWKLVTLNPKSGMTSIRATSANLYDCHATIPNPLYRNSVSATISQLRYVPMTGWFKHSDNTYCPVNYYKADGNGQIVYTHPTLGPQTYTATSSTPILFNIVGSVTSN